MKKTLFNVLLLLGFVAMFAVYMWPPQFSCKTQKAAMCTPSSFVSCMDSHECSRGGTMDALSLEQDGSKLLAQEDYPIRCPRCRTPLTLWQDNDGKYYLKCEACGWTLDL